MSSQDNNKWFEERQRGQSDRDKGLRPDQNTPQTSGSGYWSGYQKK